MGNPGWNFLLENRGRLGRNPRLTQPYRTLDRLSARRVEAIREDSARFLESLEHGAPVKAGTYVVTWTVSQPSPATMSSKPGATAPPGCESVGGSTSGYSPAPRSA